MPESIIGFGIAPARPIPDPDLGPIAFLMVTIDVSEVAAGLFDLFSFRLIASKSTPMSANGFVFAALRRKGKIVDFLHEILCCKDEIITYVQIYSS